jgi:hypothetical protein
VVELLLANNILAVAVVLVVFYQVQQLYLAEQTTQ